MKNLLIKECTLEDMEKLKYISEKTFIETFAEENSSEDMENYMRENLSYEKLTSEIKNEGSLFFLVEDNDKVVAYMKLNFDKAQTEEGHKNTLEVQRIYILEKYKGKGIGKVLIQKAKELAKENSLSYIWLGVWENNFPAIKFYEKQGFEKFSTHIFKLGNDEQIDNLMKFII